MKINHTRQRCRERFGYDLSLEEYRRLSWQAVRGDFPVAAIDNTAKYFKIGQAIYIRTGEMEDVYIVCDKHCGRIMTILPRSMIREEQMIEIFDL
jgi:hypothetical protein